MRKLHNIEEKFNYVKGMAEKYNVSFTEALDMIKFMYHIEDMEEIKKSLRWLKAR